MTDVVRAVVADRSDAARSRVTEVLRAGGIEVVGEAADGLAACSLVRSRHPSILVLGTAVAGIGTLEATRRVMAESPTPIVLVVDDTDPHQVATSLQATELGALAVLPAPPHPSAPDYVARTDRLVTMIRAMADVKVVGRRRRVGASPARRSGRAPSASGRRVEVIAVGASTGGPPALHRFLSALPAGLSAPVLVVQHIADGFVGGLVRWIAGATELDVRVATDGEDLHGGVVYVGPHGSHLEVGPRGTVHLSDSPPVSGFRPSVSVLLSSVAKEYGPRAAGVVLTGMGEDGLAGAKALVEAGGVVLAQDEASSAVFGMPRAVADLAAHVGPPEQLALRIADLVPTMKGK